MSYPIVKITGHSENRDFVTIESCCEEYSVSEEVPRVDFERIAEDNGNGTYTLNFSKLPEGEEQELNEIYEAKSTRISWLIKYMPSILRAINNKSLLYMGILGSITRKYLEKFPSNTHGDLINDINYICHVLLEIPKES